MQKQFQIFGLNVLAILDIPKRDVIMKEERLGIDTSFGKFEKIESNPSNEQASKDMFLFHPKPNKKPIEIHLT